MKTVLFILSLSLLVGGKAQAIPGTLKNVEVICGNIKDKSFPYAVAVKKKGNKHIMTLAHGRKAVLRSYAKKSILKGSFNEQYSSGSSFNLSLANEKRGYLRAKFKGSRGNNYLVAGSLTCRKVL